MVNDKIFDLMSKMYGEMQKGFNDVNERIDRVERTVINIENEHGHKLQSLYDGYKMNSEKKQNGRK